MQMIQQFSIPPRGTPVVRPLSRIMCLDDEVVDQMVCQRLVDRTQIAEELVSFTSAEAALSYFATPDHPPIDLILLDIHMPRMNGFEFLEALDRLITLTVPPLVLVMLTTPLGPAHRRQADRLDLISGYLDKPLTHEDLEGALGLLQASM